jgi:hypothetical protein
MWETIKQILSKNSRTCIVVEEGKPTYVVTRFDDYQKLLDVQPTRRFHEGLSEQELLEKINDEINDWKAKQADSNPELPVDEPDEEDLKIENLPIV